MSSEDTSRGAHDSSQEVTRLGENWRSLLEAIPEMVFLVKDDLTVEYMNRFAVDTLGDLRGHSCRDCLCNSGDRCRTLCPVTLTLAGKWHSQRSFEAQIGEMDVEYNCVPFQGYANDRLVMLLMRDISVRKRHEREIASFYENIEEVLQAKIKMLKESEGTRRLLLREVNVLKQKLQKVAEGDQMIGSSKQLQKVREIIYQVADSEATILITGESGTGKELVATMVRNYSRRCDKPYLSVNCSAINDNLLESDLFGYEKGAFTGAVGRKKGKFEIVDGGTLFLDEIGDISPRMQAALLRVLQNGEVIRVGGNQPVHVDVRIIAATNVDLAQAVQEGRFRLDLYYRLNIINIVVPPLRERKEDIVELAAFFVKRFRLAFNKEISFLPNRIIELLLQHEWPGNIRELENVIQRAVLLAKTNMITEEDLIFDIDPSAVVQDTYFAQLIGKLASLPLKELLSEVEADLIRHTVQAHGNIQDVAQHLRVGKTALYEKIKRYDITTKENPR